MEVGVGVGGKIESALVWGICVVNWLASGKARTSDESERGAARRLLGTRIAPSSALPRTIQSIHNITLDLGFGLGASIVSIVGYGLSSSLMICAAMHNGSATKKHAWKTFHHPSIPSSGLLAVYAAF